MSRSTPRRRGGRVLNVYKDRHWSLEVTARRARAYRRLGEVEVGLAEFYDTYDGGALDYVTSWIAHTVDAATRHHRGRRRGRRQRNRDRYKDTRRWFASLRMPDRRPDVGVTHPYPPRPGATADWKFKSLAGLT